MTEQSKILTVHGFEEVEKGWAIPVPDQEDDYVAILACTHQDWSNDAENYDEAPGVDIAQMIVRDCATEAEADMFVRGTREAVLQHLSFVGASPADKLMRNLLALLDAVVAGGQLYDPGTADEQESRDSLLADYAAVKAQLSEVFAYPLETDQDVRRFLLVTQEWAVQ